MTTNKHELMNNLGNDITVDLFMLLILQRKYLVVIRINGMPIPNLILTFASSHTPSSSSRLKKSPSMKPI